MENLSTEEILALVNLTLIDGEGGVHYHQDPETEFYNKCHSEKDGRFCSGPGVVSGRAPVGNGKNGNGMKTVRTSTGHALVSERPEDRGPKGASLLDPHEGTLTFDGVRGYDKKTLKPVPGTDAYLEAHHISKEIWNKRPYVKYEASKTDPALDQAFPKDKYPKGRAIFLRTAEDIDKNPEEHSGPPLDQTGGYIMYKNPAPGSPLGEIAPQIRPNVPVVTNQGDRAKALTNLKDAKERLEALRGMSTENFIKERQTHVIRAKERLERAKKTSPEKAKAAAKAMLQEKKTELQEVKARTKDPEEIRKAQATYNDAKREHDKIVGSTTKDGRRKEGRADKEYFVESEIENRTKQLKSAERRYEDAKNDPEGTLAREIKWQGGKDGKGGIIARTQKAFDNTAAKYLFTKDVSPARIDVHPDPQNIKNLAEGKGRIYFAMEGSIKNDAILTAIKKEDPTAAVVNVPSVTLWQQKNEAFEVPNEIEWFTKGDKKGTGGFAKGRDIILVPDADGHTNPAVMQQAVSLKSALELNGAGHVYLANPPLKPNTTKVVDKFLLPSGKEEERKGVDDHLGGGRGTLGQMHYSTYTAEPDYDLSWATAAAGAKKDEKISAGAIPRAEKILKAISNLVEDKGIATIPLKTLNQAAGFKPSQKTSAREALKLLEKRAKVIKVEYVYDPVEMGKGRRVRNIEGVPGKYIGVSDARLDKLIDMGVAHPPHSESEYTEVSRELSPIISIIKPEYLLKASDRRTDSVSNLPGFKPPANYKGWTSAVTGKPDTTGNAKIQRDNLAKYLQKNATTNNNVVKGDTAKERLAKKKAPPGKRLVRTKAGAKRYGVSIGQVIPMQGDIVSMTTPLQGDLVSMISPLKLDLTSMILLSSLVTEDELIAFYNQCHDENGRFCEGDNGREGGPVSGGFGSTRTIDKVTKGSVQVDGIKAKAVYEKKTEDGQVVRLYDKAGNAGPYKDRLLKTQAELHNKYPLQPPRNIVVTKPVSLFRNSTVAKDSFAVVYANSRNTYINSEQLGMDVGKNKDGFNMPSSKTGDTGNMKYLLTHEYGHHLDFDRHSSNGGYSYSIHPLYKSPTFRSTLSVYGKSDPYGIEAYAETFAEWHHSGGKTKNPATIAMAKYEKWDGAKELRASAYDFDTTRQDNQSEIIRMVLQNPIHLAKRDEGGVRDFPEDTEDDINADVPALDSTSKGVIVIDSLTDPKIIGDFEVNEPSKKEIDKADKILRGVYAELGLNYPEGDINA